jgi:hypothetical protein
VVNILALGSDGLEVSHFVMRLVRDFGQVGFDVKCKSTKPFNVYGLSCSQLLVQVSYKASPDDHHLRPRLQWLLGSVSAGGRVVVLARVLALVFIYPKLYRATYQSITSSMPRELDVC